MKNKELCMILLSVDVTSS